MPSRQTKAKRGNRMSAIQLLSFQSNLYSQTEMQLQQTTTTAPSDCHQRSCHPHGHGEEAAMGDKAARSSKGREDGQDTPLATSCAQSMRPLRNRKIRHAKRPGEQKKKWSRGGEKEEGWQEWQEAESGGAKGAELNWQQATLLQSARPSSNSSLPAWAPDHQAPSLSNKANTFSSNADKGRKKSRKGRVRNKELLPPLRFQSDQGKMAWRFVLPTPNVTRQSDLPKWYDSKVDDLVVTLGSRRSSASSTSSPAPSTPDLSRHEELSESETSESFDTSLSLIEPSLSKDQVSKPNNSPCNTLLHGIKALPVYAGPCFSAAAPEPCHLPRPSFLSRS